MDDLLVELGARQGRRRAILIGAALVAVALVPALVVASRGRSDTCGGGPARWSEAVPPGWQLAAARAFAATKLPYASRTLDTVRGSLDTYGHEWRAMYRSACEAGHRGEHSAALLDARMRCLDGRLQAATAMTARLGEADRTGIDNAITAVSALPPIEGCADVVALSAQPPPPPPIRATVAALERRIAALRTRRDLGARDGELAVEAKNVLTEARALEYLPLIASAAVEAALVAAQLGGPDAGAAIDEALAAAYRARDDAAVATSASLRGWFLSRRFGASEEGRRWGEFALVAARLRGDDRLTVRVIKSLARIELDAERTDVALELLQKAHGLAETTFGRDHTTVILFAGEIADAYRLRHEYDRAEEWATREIADLERVLGADHPTVGYAWVNAGMPAWDRGALDVAELRFARAMTIFERIMEPAHPDRLRAVSYLAEVLVERDRPDEALARLAPAIAVTATAPPIMVADLFKAQAMALRRLRRHAESESAAARSVASAETSYGADSYDLLPYLLELLSSRVAGGGDARPLYARALALAAASPDVDRWTASSHETYGEALAHAGHAADAVLPLEAAMAAFDRISNERVRAANTRVLLAGVLLDRHGDRRRVQQLLEEASAAVAGAKDGEAVRDRLAQVRGRLAAAP